MSYYPLSLLITFLINLFLAIFVFTKNVKAKTNRFFALFETCIAVWAFGMLIMILAKNEAIAMIGLNILQSALFFGFAIFFSFVLALTHDQSRINKRLSFFAYVLSIISFILDRMGLIVQKITFDFGGYYPVVAPAAQIFQISFLFFMSYGTYLLYKRYKKTESLLEKNRLKYIFAGIFIVILSSISNILLVMGMRVYPLAHIGVNIYALMVTYAIVKHRLMDIDVIIKKGIVYSLLYP